MNEDAVNMSVRKFLKKFGVQTQREIERAIRDAVREGRLSGDEKLEVRARVTLAEVGLDLTVDGTIELEQDPR